MEVAVVTRNGRGEVYLAQSAQEAREHPLVQYGDPVLQTPQDILENWNHLDIMGIASRVLDGPLLDRIKSAASMEPRRTREQALRACVDSIWDGLLRVAEPLPQDPEDICNLVRRDRRLMETTMAKAATAAAAKPEKPKREPKAKTHGGFLEAQKIYMLRDKDNKPYSAEHNPKRPSTNAHRLFSKYKNGMTVGEFIAAGGTGSALKYDSSHKFIEIK